MQFKAAVYIKDNSAEQKKFLFLLPKWRDCNFCSLIAFIQYKKHDNFSNIRHKVKRVICSRHSKSIGSSQSTQD